MICRVYIEIRVIQMQWGFTAIDNIDLDGNRRFAHSLVIRKVALIDRISLLQSYQ